MGIFGDLDTNIQRFRGRIAQYKHPLIRLEAKLGLLTDLSWVGTNTVFIVSTGRTGTKFLARFFNQFEGITSRHEPIPDCLLLGNGFATGEVSFKDAKRRLRDDRKITLKNILNGPRPENYIESNNRLFSLIPVIREVFPQPKFVHISRDGRDVVRSMMSRSAYRPGDRFRITATDFSNDPYSAKWKQFSRFEKMCWWWQKKDRIIWKEVEGENDSITVRFERVFSKTDERVEVDKLINFIDPRTVDNERLIKKFGSEVDYKINNTKHYSLPKWPNWNVKLKRTFRRIAGKHLNRLGY